MLSVARKKKSRLPAMFVKRRPELRREKSLFSFCFYCEADRNFVAPE
jgi:hypothetical protein